MTYNRDEIIKAIKTARRERGLSQRALSKKAGIPQSHISNIERGGVDIKLSTLIELMRILDLEIALVPRKLIPAVQSVIRSASRDRPGIIERAMADVPSAPKPAYTLENNGDA